MTKAWSVSRDDPGAKLVGGIETFRLNNEVSVRNHLRKELGYDGPLLDLYQNHEGTRLHKWHHYLPLYDRYFSKFRGRKVKFLEIGVHGGGSLAMWREFLGDRAELWGIDIDPRCARFDGRDGHVRIGSQNDTDFLAGLVEEMGGVDVVLDDGSHVMDDIRVSLNALFPHMSDGGIYMIEDLHCAYWKSYGGGVRKPGNFFEQLPLIIEDMHHWYHSNETNVPALKGSVKGLHVHDSIVVFEKDREVVPVHSIVGV